MPNPAAPSGEVKKRRRSLDGQNDKSSRVTANQLVACCDLSACLVPGSELDQLPPHNHNHNHTSHPCRSLVSRDPSSLRATRGSLAISPRRLRGHVVAGARRAPRPHHHLQQQQQHGWPRVRSVPQTTRCRPMSGHTPCPCARPRASRLSLVPAAASASPPRSISATPSRSWQSSVRCNPEELALTKPDLSACQLLGCLHSCSPPFRSPLHYQVIEHALAKTFPDPLTKASFLPFPTAGVTSLLPSALLHALFRHDVTRIHVPGLASTKIPGVVRVSTLDPVKLIFEKLSWRGAPLHTQVMSTDLLVKSETAKSLIWTTTNATTLDPSSDVTSPSPSSARARTGSSMQAQPRTETYRIDKEMMMANTSFAFVPGQIGHQSRLSHSKHRNDRNEPPSSKDE